MKIGMLWFDDDPQATLAVKVEQAATYYQRKYGKKPTVCFVHPSMLPRLGQEEQELISSDNGLEVEAASNQPKKCLVIKRTKHDTTKKRSAAAHARKRAGQTLSNDQAVRSSAHTESGRDESQAQLETSEFLAGGVEVRPNAAVRPNHFWIGVNGVLPVSSTTNISSDRSTGISPDLTLSSASSSR